MVRRHGWLHPRGGCLSSSSGEAGHGSGAAASQVWHLLLYCAEVGGLNHLKTSYLLGAVFVLSGELPVDSFSVLSVLLSFFFLSNLMLNSVSYLRLLLLPPPSSSGASRSLSAGTVAPATPEELLLQA